MAIVKKPIITKVLFILAGCILVGMLPGSAGAGRSQVGQNEGYQLHGEIHPGDEFLSNAKNEDYQIEPERTASLRFAVIGDYGDYANNENTPEIEVADLIKSWAPDIILTTGDNNYDDGAEETIDENIGQFFHEYIYPYYGKYPLSGSYGKGADVNRFFPSLGNHDWDTIDTNGLPKPYLDYFTLPGNERYYDFSWGPVHFFVIDSDPHEPDGFEWDSDQANWLQTQLTKSVYPWKVVVMHHPPFSSGKHGSAYWMRWPFAEWGADVVLAGHDHTYERISPPDGVLYFVNGLGGKSIYDFPAVVDGSQVRYNDDYGAMLVDVSIAEIRFRFINRQDELIDDYRLVKEFSFSFLPIIMKNYP